MASCTAPTDQPEPGTHAAVNEAAVPLRCNTKIADAESAIELAESAKLAAGFLDTGEIEIPQMSTRSFWRISAMVPSAWPATDCTISFYVFRVDRFGRSLDDRHGPVVARIDVPLDAGAVQVVMLDEAPTAGSTGRHDDRAPASDEQQWVFDAVATSSEPQLAAARADYREWLKDEETVAAALYMWHREFFDFVVGADEQVLQTIERNLWPQRVRQGPNGPVFDARPGRSYPPVMTDYRQDRPPAGVDPEAL